MTDTIEERESVLFGPSKGMAGQLASRMIDDGVIEELMPPQKKYREARRKEVRRMLFNLIRAQSLSRAHGKLITVAVPLRSIKHNEGEYYRISYRGLKAVLEEFRKAGMIEIERGSFFINTAPAWKKSCVRNGNTKNRMTEIWATDRLKEKIDDYLRRSTHVGADVKILVEETGIVLKDNEGQYVRSQTSPTAKEMKQAVSKVNSEFENTDVVLRLPLSVLSDNSQCSDNFVNNPPADNSSKCAASTLTASQSSHTSPPPSSSISVNTSPQRPQKGIQDAHNEVIRRCPQAWSWKHSLAESRSHIIYDIPASALRYTRKFVRGSWDCGGRFYAPVQNVPSGWRPYMEIGGEPACELDYDNLHIHMLYAREGKELKGDAYDVASYDLGTEMNGHIGLGEEEKKFYRCRQRDVVKKALNILINAENYQSAYAALRHTCWTEEIGLPLADEVFKPLVHALKQKHGAIEDYFHSDVGIKLQRKDSDLAYQVMRETGAIGIHDGFAVEAGQQEELREAMKEAFAEEYDGYDIPVSHEFEPLAIA